ncbi:MAG: transglutaminase domain-containing protein [Eubacterium sp.]|nr:transglutaminase domain-containing protein [Eubacterium sp.]
MKKLIRLLFVCAVLGQLFIPTNSVIAAEPGLTEEDGKIHYYDDKGELVTDKCAIEIKVDGKTGYYKIDKEGNVTQWKDEKALAAKRLIKLKAVPKDSTDAKQVEKCLKKAFKWSSKIEYVNLTKNIKKDKKALQYYGKYGFVKSKGDCNVQAATFTLMAEVLGYDATFVRGLVPQALKNGKPAKFGAHSWVTIKMGKKKYVFDPNFEKTHKAGWKFKYKAKKHYRYFTKKKKEIKK